MPRSPEALRPDPRRLIVLAWVAYAAYYLGRVNLAIALPAIQSELGLTAAQVGLFGTLFFWVYAVGQLVNGRLGDRFSPRRFVLIGLWGFVIPVLRWRRCTAPGPRCWHLWRSVFVLPLCCCGCPPILPMRFPTPMADMITGMFGLIGVPTTLTRWPSRDDCSMNRPAIAPKPSKLPLDFVLYSRVYNVHVHAHERSPA